MNNSSETADAVVVECDLPHPPEKVWRALTDQDLLGAWLVPNDIRPEVGTHFVLQSREEGSKAHPVECEIVEAVPDRRLRWRQSERDCVVHQEFIDSIVTFELSGLPNGGTHLKVVHDGFVRRSSNMTQSGRLSVIRADVVELVPRDRRVVLRHARRTDVLCIAGSVSKAA